MKYWIKYLLHFGRCRICAKHTTVYKVMDLDAKPKVCIICMEKWHHEDYVSYCKKQRQIKKRRIR